MTSPSTDEKPSSAKRHEPSFRCPGCQSPADPSKLRLCPVCGVLLTPDWSILKAFLVVAATLGGFALLIFLGCKAILSSIDVP